MASPARDLHSCGTDLSGLIQRFSPWLCGRFGYRKAGTSKPVEADEATLAHTALAEHLLGFLRLYGTEFDFRKHAISLNQPDGLVLLRIGKKDKRTPEQLLEQHGWLHKRSSFGGKVVSTL